MSYIPMYTYMICDYKEMEQALSRMFQNNSTEKEIEIPAF